MEEPRSHGSGPGLIAGLDEAGLGPLLGPLVLGYCVLDLPRADLDPWEVLSAEVARAGEPARGRLVVADSKLLYDRSAGSARNLEETALCFLACARAEPRVPAGPEWMWTSALRPEPAWIESAPWYAAIGERLPLWSTPERIAAGTERLAQVLRASGMAVRAAGVRLVPAGELNRSFVETDNKSTSLWGYAREILRLCWDEYGTRGIHVEADRQGGRIRYRGLLEQAFPEAEVHARHERASGSSYVLVEVEAGTLYGAPGGRRMQLELAPKSDSRHFSTALASCLAKYARECTMLGFNRYFSRFQPELAPTAGYVTDGRRWIHEARAAVELSGIARERLVRTR